MRILKLLSRVIFISKHLISLRFKLYIFYLIVALFFPLSSCIELDENHDSEINWDEFVAWYEKREAFFV